MSKFLILFVSISLLYGFNWNRCKQEMRRNRVPFGFGTDLMTSTSGFTSSTGQCAMIGETEHDKKVYFVHNFDKMKDDFAKGYGEYSSSFAKMHGCGTEQQRHFSKIMKLRYQELISIESQNSPETTFKYLEEKFQYDIILKTGCSAVIKRSMSEFT